MGVGKRLRIKCVCGGVRYQEGSKNYRSPGMFCIPPICQTMSLHAYQIPLQINLQSNPSHLSYSSSSKELPLAHTYSLNICN